MSGRFIMVITKIMPHHGSDKKKHSMNKANKLKIISSIIALCALLGSQAPQRPDVVVADFEGKDYGGWTATGTAFGTGPSQGGFSNQMPVSGYLGHGLVNSFGGDDAKTGTLTSPPFVITRHYLNFLIGGGKHPGETCMNLLIDGKIVRTASGPNGQPGGSERLDWQTWDVHDLEGTTVRLEIVDRATGGWGHVNIDQIMQSDEKQADDIKTDELYNETYRPQFHFSAQKGWLNDPNGMVFYKGEYHLFFQHNPFGLQSGNLSWGHAVSKDMTHWQQIGNAITPDQYGPIWSGSAVVDWNNTTGFATDKEKPIVATYTAAGDTSPESKGVAFTQRMVYSVDRGRTWTKYAGNPVLPHIIGGDRDPKVTWYAPGKKWILALYLDREDYALYASPDLKSWTHLQTFTTPGCSECPDFFEMPVEGKPNETRWVFTAANGKYLVGAFDGQKFTYSGNPLQVDYGANYYAVQTFSDIPHSDGRRIQIAWMAGGAYPQMPFNQQMSYPCAMTLHETPEGLRIFRQPVKEIASLYGKEARISNKTLKPNEFWLFAYNIKGTTTINGVVQRNVNEGDNPLNTLSSELWDARVEFEPGNATAFVLRVRGEDIRYNVKDQTVTCLGRTAPLKIQNGRIVLRALVDRTSLEVFGNQGQASLTSCFLPRQKDTALSVYAEGGDVKLVSLSVHPLRSAWKRPNHD